MNHPNFLSTPISTTETLTEVHHQIIEVLRTGHLDEEILTPDSRARFVGAEIGLRCLLTLSPLPTAMDPAEGQEGAFWPVLLNPPPNSEELIAHADTLDENIEILFEDGHPHPDDDHTWRFRMVGAHTALQMAQDPWFDGSPPDEVFAHLARSLTP
jgi:hypothetical protein